MGRGCEGSGTVRDRSEGAEPISCVLSDVYSLASDHDGLMKGMAGNRGKIGTSPARIRLTFVGRAFNQKDCITWLSSTPFHISPHLRCFVIPHLFLLRTLNKLHLLLNLRKQSMIRSQASDLLGSLLTSIVLQDPRQRLTSLITLNVLEAQCHLNSSQ